MNKLLFSAAELSELEKGSCQNQDKEKSESLYIDRPDCLPG